MKSIEPFNSNRKKTAQTEDKETDCVDSRKTKNEITKADTIYIESETMSLHTIMI